MPVQIQHAVDQHHATPQGAGKRMYVKSYGCQMNVYDGLRMAELMQPLGYTLQETPEGADLILLNTCHIREKADEKVFSDIGRMQKVAADQAIIGVGGCVGQAMGARIMQRAPAVSVVFGPQTYHRLPALIEKVEAGREQRLMGHKNAPIRATDTEFPELEKFDSLPQTSSYGPSAFVTIQEGCDKFCTYCVVPYTRGAEISRPVQSILDECRHLADNGTREVVLLGQNVNAYHGEDATGTEWTLAQLCAAIAQIDGIERIRFTTSHPMNTTPDLIEAFATQPKLMPYFHLPVQAGSNKILRAMNRSHTAEQYLQIVEAVKQARPDIAMSGDFIVGFPGETEDDFNATLAIAHTTGYASCYSFAYSPRPGTPGADMPDQIAEAVKKERLAGLQALLSQLQADFNARFAGGTLPILVEELNEQGQLRGRSPHNVAVNFSTQAAHPRALIGQIVDVHISSARPKSLLGEMLSYHE